MLFDDVCQSSTLFSLWIALSLTVVIWLITCSVTSTEERRAILAKRMMQLPGADSAYRSLAKVETCCAHSGGNWSQYGLIRSGDEKLLLQVQILLAAAVTRINCSICS